MLRFFHLVFFLVLSMMPTLLRADIFRLKDGTTLTGVLTKFNENTFTLVSGRGETFNVERSKISLIEISSDATTITPQANLSSQPAIPTEVEKVTKGPYETPTQTFFTWRKAALKDDNDAMVHCYASFKQNEIKKDLKKISKTKRKEMQEAAMQTQFFPNDPFYQGDRATLEVTWQKGLQSDVQILQFILEGNAWKIVQ